MNTASLGVAVLCLAAGVGIPIMAALNGALGSALASTSTAAFVLFCVGGAISLAALLLSGNGLQTAPTGTPIYYYAGGVFVAFYILTITWAAPRLGVGNAIVFVLFGQILAFAVIDQWGLFGALRTSMTPARLLGLVLLSAGVYLTRRPG